jgi:hypothetical protein
VEVDARMPQQIICNIEAQGRIVYTDNELEREATYFK